MVLTVLSSFVVLLIRLSPDWSDVFEGYLPSSTLVAPGALYIAVGIIGATVMPHALFLGAKLGTIRRIEDDHDEKVEDVEELKALDGESRAEISEMTVLSGGVLRSPRVPMSPRGRSTTSTHRHAPSLHMPHPTPMPEYPLKELPKSERSAKFIRIHLHHAQIDIAYSLFCFALVTNSAILTVAGAAFYYREGAGDVAGVQEGDLFSAHELIKTRVGTGESDTIVTCLPFEVLKPILPRSFRFPLCARPDDERASCIHHCYSGWPSRVRRLHRVENDPLEATSYHALHQYDTRFSGSCRSWTEGSKHPLSSITGHIVSGSAFRAGTVSVSTPANASWEI